MARSEVAGGGSPLNMGDLSRFLGERRGRREKKRKIPLAILYFHNQ